MNCCFVYRLCDSRLAIVLNCICNKLAKLRRISAFFADKTRHGVCKSTHQMSLSDFCRQNARSAKGTKQSEIENGHGRQRVGYHLPTISWIPQVVVRTRCAVTSTPKQQNDERKCSVINNCVCSGYGWSSRSQGELGINVISLGF